MGRRADVEFVAAARSPNRNGRLPLTHKDGFAERLRNRLEKRMTPERRQDKMGAVGEHARYGPPCNLPASEATR
jgi:hypothetical protein